MKAQVILYTKPGCHLCEVMKREIASAGCDELFVLEEINIENDPELFARFRFDIPILFINGTQTFQHRLTAESFKEALTRVITRLS
jgi:glutaredoxin